MRRDHWRQRNAALDPTRDHVEIYRNVVMYEFPWDMNQALSFALFRTYAVPGIGRLLDETGEFTGRTQKRYDDTALLLEAPSRLGFDHPEARAAIRRINGMHRAYDIPDHEFRYVLSTFVVVPKRWLDTYGKRPLDAGELEASVHYYRALGARMGIPDIPETYDGFATLMDDYEAEHFAFEPGARRVADSTLALLLTFHPRLPKRMVEVFSRALMDDELLDALGYDHPPRAVTAASRAALRLRGRIARLLPANRTPTAVADLPWVRSYPDGYDIEHLGTFPSGCPVPHEARTDAARHGERTEPGAA
ncbi:oxygenase MpaB family protein [Agromyces mangrovi Wang et al. 2018]|uniref:oxygenase MpaB family protein n=1 Tax=Agromyces mangrovi TaxID=1858653 RepID=UPI00257328D4|nr:oxygenase MpaB family protein [Agromyces mangrovi]BDZ63452.1 peptidase [Agromyces mangrovi]